MSQHPQIAHQNKAQIQKIEMQIKEIKEGKITTFSSLVPEQERMRLKTEKELGKQSKN